MTSATMSSSETVFAPRPRRPAFPATRQHTPYYCEENVYQLIRTLVQDGVPVEQEAGAQVEGKHSESKDEWEIYAVFVTNQNKTVAMWYQRGSSRSPDDEGAWSESFGPRAQEDWSKLIGKFLCFIVL